MNKLIYCKLKLIGKVKVTDTALPLCFAGIIDGIAFTNLNNFNNIMFCSYFVPVM